MDGKWESGSNVDEIGSCTGVSLNSNAVYF